MLMNVKVQIARAQLGTAFSLFIRDKDPISVQALACGGSEIIEGLAKEREIPTLSSHIMETVPGVKIQEIKRLRNKYWNAIKHFYDRDYKTVRDDEKLMIDFRDSANDAVLFMGWLDYMLVMGRLPFEAQVFQVWWYATNEEKLSPDSDLTPHRNVFPNIGKVERAEQKRRLRRAIEKYRKNRIILADPRTERGPLVVKT